MLVSCSLRRIDYGFSQAERGEAYVSTTTSMTATTAVTVQASWNGHENGEWSFPALFPHRACLLYTSPSPRD